MKRISCLFAFLLYYPCFITGVAYTETINLVEDFVAGESSSNPRILRANGNFAIVSVPQANNTLNIYSTDGTPQNATLLATIEDSSLSHGYYYIKTLKFNSKIIFIENGNNNGPAIWVTDGTNDGTTSINTPKISSSDSIYINNYSSNSSHFYFVGEDSDYGVELRKSNGSQSGTTIVKDLSPGSSHTAYSDLYFVPGGSFFFWARRMNDAKYHLWRSNGTESGTHMVANMSETYSYPPSTVAVGNGVVFISHNCASGSICLRFVGGSSGPAMEIANLQNMLSIDPDTDVYVLDAQSVNGKGFLILDVAGQKYLIGTDGTSIGTKSLLPASASAEMLWIINNTVYFTADVDGTENYELFVTDGTIDGTIQLTFDIPIGMTAAALTYIDGKIYFRTHTSWSIGAGSSYGGRIYVTDGTPEGTLLLEDAFADFGIGTSENVNGIISFGTLGSGNVYFPARTPDAGVEIWRSDGTPHDASLVGEIIPGPEGSFLSAFFSVGGRILFTANSLEYGNELFAISADENCQNNPDCQGNGDSSGGGSEQVDITNLQTPMPSYRVQGKRIYFSGAYLEGSDYSQCNMTVKYKAKRGKRKKKRFGFNIYPGQTTMLRVKGRKAKVLVTCRAINSAGVAGLSEPLKFRIGRKGKKKKTKKR